MAASTLYDHYAEQKKPLPSLKERGELYKGAGFTDPYVGSAKQNTALLGHLQKPPAAPDQSAARAQLEQEAKNMAQFGHPTAELAKPQGKVSANPSAPAGFGTDERGRLVKTDAFGKADPYMERQPTTAPENRQHQDAEGNLIPPPQGVPPAPETPAAPAAAPAPAAPASPAEGGTAAPAAAKPQTYSVQAGDNLTRIARKYGTTVSALLAANPQIKNPNLIFAGQQLAIPPVGAAGFQLPSGTEIINGAQYPTRALQEANFSDIQMTPDGQHLYGRRVNPADSINAQQKAALDALTKGKESADKTVRESAKEEAYKAEIDKILGTGENAAAGGEIPPSVTASDGSVVVIKGDQTALGLYKELMRSPELVALEKKANEKQQELDKITATEVALANDIRKEIEGEAPQSYIDALTAERMKDLYPKKIALVAELRNLTAQLTAEKENAANILQFTLKDQDTRYNRLFQMLQFEAQQNQKRPSNDLAVLSLIKDLPSGRSITVNGKEYKGLSETANLSVIQFTDKNGNITVVGLDKMDGTVKYTKVIGHAKVTGSGSGDSSYVKQLAEFNAKTDLEIRKGVADGTYVETQLPDQEGIHIIRAKDYEADLKKWADENPATWYNNDETVTFRGKTYRGTADKAPSIADYEVYLSK